MRINEKRNFELENCKLNAYENNNNKNYKENNEMIIENTEQVNEQEENNIYEGEAQIIDNLDTFEITNSQMF